MAPCQALELSQDLRPALYTTTLPGNLCLKQQDSKGGCEIELDWQELRIYASL